MHNIRKFPYSTLALLSGSALVSGVAAAPLEGTVGSNAAALLVVLGVIALFFGIRNLRSLRYKRLVPRREPETDAAGGNTAEPN